MQIARTLGWEPIEGISKGAPWTDEEQNMMFDLEPKLDPMKRPTVLRVRLCGLLHQNVCK